MDPFTPSNVLCRMTDAFPNKDVAKLRGRRKLFVTSDGGLLEFADMLPSLPGQLFFRIWVLKPPTPDTFHLETEPVWSAETATSGDVSQAKVRPLVGSYCQP